MKQLQFSFKDSNSLDEQLHELRKYYDENSFYGMLIHIYTEITEKERIAAALKKI